MAVYAKPLDTGDLQEVQALTTTKGAPDAFKIVQTNASGMLDPSLIPSINIINFTASEAIAAGAMINVYDAGGGVTKIRNASNTGAGTRAHGFVQAAVAAGASGGVTLHDGLISGLSGLVTGAEYVLGTGGQPTQAAPTATGSIVQRVGVAKSTTELAFAAGLIITRA